MFMNASFSFLLSEANEGVAGATQSFSFLTAGFGTWLTILSQPPQLEVGLVMVI
jgi:hypothetical protein